jgi:hypothetical protein
VKIGGGGKTVLAFRLEVDRFVPEAAVATAVDSGGGGDCRRRRFSNGRDAGAALLEDGEGKRAKVG